MDESSAQAALISQQAIEAALDARWNEAIKLNTQIIKVDPKNIDALNRQARAYLEMGKFNLAQKYYSQVLLIDAYNPIAQKNLKIIKTCKKNGKGLKPNSNNTPHIRISPSFFLHEPGKTKIVNLLKVAEPQKLSRTFSGMAVNLVVKNKRLAVLDSEGGYLGVLPDDLSHQLLRLINGGNKYLVFVKSVKVNGLAVLIREIVRSKKFKNQPTFLDTSNTPTVSDIIAPIHHLGDSDDPQTEGETEENI